MPVGSRRTKVLIAHLKGYLADDPLLISGCWVLYAWNSVPECSNPGRPKPRLAPSD